VSPRTGVEFLEKRIYSGIHNPDRRARSLVITQTVQAPETN